MGESDMSNKITIAMPYYEAPEMLRVHLDYWRRYPEWMAEFLSVVLVDDGSPNHPAERVLKESDLPLFPIQLYRVQENIPWNHGGARNLTMHCVPKKGWVVTTDIDLVLDSENIEKILGVDMRKKNVYRPNRLDLISGKWVQWERHPESFVMTREMFWKIGGFDEDFTGYWNGTFVPFRKAVKRVSTLVDWQDIYLKNHCGLVEGAMVAEWGRRKSEYDIHTNKSMLTQRRRATNNYQPKNPLRFTWEQLI